MHIFSGKQICAEFSTLIPTDLVNLSLALYIADPYHYTEVAYLGNIKHRKHMEEKNFRKAATVSDFFSPLETTYSVTLIFVLFYRKTLSHFLEAM